ncbi:MAG TPA: hybrid sensor histidine kinase/response regulator, partial [Caulobacteraceae bacterium]
MSPAPSADSPARDWTDILAYRRRDRRIILPLTFLAAAASAYLMDLRFAGLWLGGNLAVVALGVGLCGWIERRRAPTRRWETTLAAFTFFHTAAYCTLPVALAAQGSKAATVAGLAIIGGVAMSSLDEFV